MGGGGGGEVRYIFLQKMSPPSLLHKEALSSVYDLGTRLVSSQLHEMGSIRTVSCW